MPRIEEMSAATIASILDGDYRGNEVRCPAPGHSAKDRSLVITLTPGQGKGYVFNAWAGEDFRSVDDYVRARLGLGKWTPDRDTGGKSEEDIPRHPKHGRPTHFFRYRNEIGEQLFAVARWDSAEGKKIAQCIPVGGVWKWTGYPGVKPLYRLRALKEDTNRTVFVVEGEKKADALAFAVPNAAVASWAGGSSAVKQTDWSPLAGRAVVVWPDNDAPGVKALNAVAALAIKAGAKSVRYVPLSPDKKKGWDADDAVNREGWDKEQILAWLRERMKPWEGDVSAPSEVVVPIRAGIEIGTAPEKVPAPDFSEEALALYFAEQHAEDLRFVALWNKWLFWDNRRWVIDATLSSYNRVRTICRATARAYAEVSKSPAGPKAMASAKTVNAVTSLARADRRIAATVDQWDSHDWLLNTPDGTIDLLTQEMRPPAPSDHLTHITAVSPGGKCPQWLDFMKTVTGGDQNLIDYLQRVFGYCLTGATSEHALFFLYGTGANGKSVMLNTVSGILGDHAKTAPIETFTLSKGDRHPTELARLRGARLVTAIETEDGRRWAESRIKSLTGGDKIAARFMKEDFFEYWPKFKLIIAGNHKPGLRSVDEAIRRRFNLIPFAVTIPVEQRDEELPLKLKAEWPGILAWMMDGCVEWQASGLRPPQAVLAATAAYLEAEDALSAWIDDACVLDVNGFEPIKSLFQSWISWAKAAGEPESSQKALSQKLEARGFTYKRTASQRGYEGIRLKVTSDTGGYGHDHDR